LLGLLLVSATVQAEGGAAPSMALLAFLGEWDDEDAVWVDLALEQGLDEASMPGTEMARGPQVNEESDDEE
jgi:hypothetical protein